VTNRLSIMMPLCEVWSGKPCGPFASLGIDLEEVQKGFSDRARSWAPSGSVSSSWPIRAEVILPACGCVNTIVVREKITEMEGLLILDINALL